MRTILIQFSRGERNCLLRLLFYSMTNLSSTNGIKVLGLHIQSDKGAYMETLRPGHEAAFVPLKQRISTKRLTTDSIPQCAPLRT